MNFILKSWKQKAVCKQNIFLFFFVSQLTQEEKRLDIGVGTDTSKVILTLVLEAVDYV